MKSGSPRSLTRTKASGVGKPGHAREPVAARRPTTRSRCSQPCAPRVVADAARQRHARAAARRDDGRVGQRAAAVGDERVGLREARAPAARRRGRRGPRRGTARTREKHNRGGVRRAERQVPGLLSSALGAPLVAAVACTAFALWNPPLRDLAAHTFRAEFFERARLRDLEQHLVRRPLPARLQRAVPAAGRAAVAGLGRRPRRRSRARICSTPRARALGRAARWAGLWFAALGAVALLANGWLVFALGVAFGARRAARAAARAGRPRRSPWRSGARWRARWRRRSWRWCARSARSTRRAAPACCDRRRGPDPAGACSACCSRRRRVPVLVLRLVAAGAVLRPGAAGDPRQAPSDATCARSVVGVPGAGDARLARTEPARRQHDPARLAVRRARAARRAARAAPARLAPSRSRRSSSGSRGRWSRRCGRRGEPRRPRHRALLLRAAEGWLDARERAARAHRDPADVQPLGDRIRLAALLAGAGMAAPARPASATDLLRGRADARELPPLAARQRASATSRPPTRGSTTRPQDEDRLMREEPPYLRLRARLDALARVRGGRRDADCSRRWGSAGPASRGWTPESFVLERERAGPVRRARAPHALLGRSERASAWARPATGRWCG